MKADRSEVWKGIWNKKGQQANSSLHHIDGFDLLDVKQWNRMVYQITKPIGIKSGDLIFECGCGAGAFLLSILKYYPDIKVSGIDYSESLLEIARKSLNGDFYYADMTNIDFVKSNKYDHVVSFSTFHYLSSEESVRKAVREMVRITKVGGSVFIGEVSDLAKRKDAVSIRELTHKNHVHVSASNPDHLFLPKNLFRELAEDMSLHLTIVDQDTFDLPFYETAKYRYSVYLIKNKCSSSR